jgi:hypothetical protein
LGFSAKAESDNRFSKSGECSDLIPLEKHLASLKLVKITPPKFATPVVRDGVLVEHVITPPQKLVWCLIPNHLRNPLDTLPNISSHPLPKAPQPPKKTHSHKQIPPKREVRYHCKHHDSYRHFRRPEAAENKPFAAENKLFSAAKGLFSAVSGRQKNRPKIRLYFWRPEPGRRKQLIFGGWLSGRRK